jgi:predicted ABC-type ATPase
MAAPVLYVIAGPNGIGKTTSDYYFLPANIPVINSDEIAAEFKRSGQAVVNTQEIANAKASELLDGYLNQIFVMFQLGNGCWKYRKRAT